MSIFTIYSSLIPEVELEFDYIYENRPYYIVFQQPDSDLVKEMLSKERIRRHIKWYPSNKVAELRICNFIGNFRIFDRVLDVRSEKFDSRISGVEQIKCIIDELDNLNKKISFSYSSSVFVRSDADWNSVESDLLHTVNYLHQIFFEIDFKNRVRQQFDSVKNNPSVTHDAFRKTVPLWSLKNISTDLMLDLVKKGYRSKTELGGADFVRSQAHNLTNDTQENQFIKYFFEYSMQIALKVITLNRGVPVEVHEKSAALANACRGFLSDAFFLGVSSCANINTNSTVLRSRSGYRDFLKFYFDSLFTVRPIYDVNHDLKTDLIDIAVLYEIWCFYKVAFLILGATINVKKKSSYIKDGQIKHSAIFENELYEVGYNRVFSLKSFTSYSTTLRPDISVYSKVTGENFHFDAKYRLNSYVGVDDSEYKVFKNDDINKMHAYLDAIYCTRSAVVLYPGNLYKFFLKAPQPLVFVDELADHELLGVGAIPLVPGGENRKFDNFIKKYFSS